MNSRSTTRVCLLSAAALIVLLVLSRPSDGGDADQLQVPKGFVVRQYADDNLAHNVFSMTIDSLGRVVVSGPGYVRILVDADHDGVAESYKQFADGPASGAQGMFFLGRDLLCTGDGGLVRYRDQNKDDRADGPPDVFLKLRTGGEHHAHAVQKGPDGWWYIVVGNDGGVSSSYASLPTSPVKTPRAGTLIRLKPDLSGGEIVADGMRNTYDFAFNSAGDLFAFDSDNERDVSLPWYRPIRVLHLVPGSDAGFVSGSWIRPAGYLDMPTVVASFGRGSPTGVVCYRHHQFPPGYHDALFVLDWTFGRVMAVRLTNNGAGWAAGATPFITAKGEFGFAPTDVEIGPDGSLFVSVGGRGTRGGVYRVAYKGESGGAGAKSPEAVSNSLSSCLTALQPQSSWSRAAWIPVAKRLGRATFLSAATSSLRTAAERVRAIEIVTELFGGIDPQSLVSLAAESSPAVRARAVWSAGRSSTPFPPESLKPFIEDSEPWVARAALEALQTVRLDGPIDLLLPAIIRRLDDSDRLVRLSAARLIGRFSENQASAVLVALGESNLLRKLWFAFGRCERTTDLNLPSLLAALDVLEKADSPAPELRSDALRVMQIALGDCGPASGKGAARTSAVFHGYESRLDLSAHERELDPVRIRLARLFPTKSPEVDDELARVIGMLAPLNSALLDRLLDQITAESDPVRDIHYLIVAARMPVERDERQSQRIAGALVNLDAKIAARKLSQDRNWDDRVSELYRKLVSLDEDLPAAVVGQKDFGRPGHVLFLSEISSELLTPAVAAFIKQIEHDPQYKWTPGVVFLLGESSLAEHRELVRKKYSEFPLRSAVVMTLAQRPQEIDRAKFIEGLDSSQREVVDACLGALEKLPPRSSAGEAFALVALLGRLSGEKSEFVLRERVARLLAHTVNNDFGFVYGEAGRKPQPEVLKQADAWLDETYPAEFRRLKAMAGDDARQVGALLADVEWERGDAGRGHKVFETRTCSQCHGGASALGPELSGAARRFSRADLFTAIVDPNRDVSPRYHTTMIETRGGKVYTGMIVYESVDGLILRNANQTIRINAGEIEERRTLKTSLMPANLLKGLSAAELADLYAYLRSLGGDPVATAPLPAPAPAAAAPPAPNAATAGRVD